MKFYGRVVDPNTGETLARIEIDDTDGANTIIDIALDLARRSERAVQIMYECVICEKLFSPFSGYKEQFCSLACYE
jgi:hypothetical protein